MTEIVIGGFVAAACLISAVILFSGHGVFMVATLNRMDPAEREASYDVPRACRITGVFAAVAGVSVLVFIALRYVALTSGLPDVVMSAYTVVMFAAIVLSLVWSVSRIESRCRIQTHGKKKSKKKAR
ncbi:DUF3784 domain-containing protein [uncultured Slackia sp.]|uniref:DUF3784 domain-containing protein n=1 Tax=uncultured Slackia sp. TaxID=665903 RepID=UPI0026DECEBF|nr:DUF3784 domain-containing protein [uncultured Slackia sp.]